MNSLSRFAWELPDISTESPKFLNPSVLEKPGCWLSSVKLTLQGEQEVKGESKDDFQDFRLGT